MTSDPPTGSHLVHRVRIRDYKSIAACDVRLGPLTVLVGPNGAGKSNFLDALRFVTDSLRGPLEHALRARGGIEQVQRRGAERPGFAIRLDFRLPDGSCGHYSIEIGAAGDGTLSVMNEECELGRVGSPTWQYRVSGGEVVTSTLQVAPAAVQDRLYLVNVSGIPEFRPLYDAISSMGFYNLNPDVIRDLQPRDSGDLLARDGSNLASVLGTLAARDPLAFSLVEEYLAEVVPGIDAVHAYTLGPRETIAFNQGRHGNAPRGRFLAASMSDGTLRVLGVLAALFQGGSNGSRSSLLVGIEEPETALHPAATEVLLDSLRHATEHRQVLVTSHSPDLIDSKSIYAGEILAVTAENGVSQIGHLDPAQASVIEDRLYTPGQLLRMGQLRPEPAALALEPEQVTIFGDAGRR